ncbi:MAG: hypothetical protein CL607_20525 [Anaerolineaceae bacterium]|nr:hypothetical protein [Anaerolineaceae bacterium]
MYAKNDMPLPQVKSGMATIPMNTPSPYAPQAERALQAAFSAYQRDDWGDALMMLADAVAADPRLQDDALAQHLAATLTGQMPETVLTRIGFTDQRWQFIEALQPDPERNTRGLRTVTAFIFSTLIALGMIYVVANWLPNITQIARDPLEDIQIYSHTLINGVTYDVYEPSGPLAGPGWPMLVLLGDEDLQGDDLLAPFVVANTSDTLYVTPHLPMQPADVNLPILQEIITDVENTYPTALDSVVLFGFGEGGALASLYANQHPDIIAGTIISGATWIYPQDEGSGPMLVMIGSQDPLYLRSNQGNDMPFIDEAQWPGGLQYLLLENIGHEVTPYQVDAALQMTSEIHLDAVK